MSASQHVIRIPPACRERYLDLLGPAGAPLRRAGVVFAGVSNLVDGYLNASPLPAGAHMVILTDGGRGRLRAAGEDLVLEAGDFLLGPAGHAYEFFTEGERWDISWFYLEDGAPRRGLRGPVVRARGAETTALTAAMEGHLRERGRRDDAAAAAYATLAVVLLERLLSGAATPAPDTAGSALEALWRDVRADPGRPWRATELARAAGLSPSTLQRRTRERWGLAPHRIVTDLRMEQACLLLARSDYPLKLIASRLGYANEFVFSAAFRRWSGKSPSAWRMERTGAS